MEKSVMWGIVVALLVSAVLVLAVAPENIFILENDVRLSSQQACGGLRSAIACSPDGGEVMCQCAGGQVVEPLPDGTCNPPCEPTLISPGGTNVCAQAIQWAADKCGPDCVVSPLYAVITGNGICCMGVVECSIDPARYTA